jgi:hypothetical protein
LPFSLGPLVWAEAKGTNTASNAEARKIDTVLRIW